MRTLSSHADNNNNSACQENHHHHRADGCVVTANKNKGAAQVDEIKATFAEIMLYGGNNMDSFMASVEDFMTDEEFFRMAQDNMDVFEQIHHTPTEKTSNQQDMTQQENFLKLFESFSDLVVSRNLPSRRARKKPSQHHAVDSTGIDNSSKAEKDDCEDKQSTQESMQKLFKSFSELVEAKHLATSKRHGGNKSLKLPTDLAAPEEYFEPDEDEQSKYTAITEATQESATTSSNMSMSPSARRTRARRNKSLEDVSALSPVRRPSKKFILSSPIKQLEKRSMSRGKQRSSTPAKRDNVNNDSNSIKHIMLAESPKRPVVKKSLSSRRKKKQVDDDNDATIATAEYSRGPRRSSRAPLRGQGGLHKRKQGSSSSFRSPTTVNAACGGNGEDGGDSSETMSIATTTTTTSTTTKATENVVWESLANVIRKGPLSDLADKLVVDDYHHTNEGKTGRSTSFGRLGIDCKDPVTGPYSRQSSNTNLHNHEMTTGVNCNDCVDNNSVVDFSTKTVSGPSSNRSARRGRLGRTVRSDENIVACTNNSVGIRGRTRQQGNSSTPCESRKRTNLARKGNSCQSLASPEKNSKLAIGMARVKELQQKKTRSSSVPRSSRKASVPILTEKNGHTTTVSMSPAVGIERVKEIHRKKNKTRSSSVPRSGRGREDDSSSACPMVTIQDMQPVAKTIPQIPESKSLIGMARIKKLQQKKTRSSSAPRPGRGLLDEKSTSRGGAVTIAEIRQAAKIARRTPCSPIAKSRPSVGMARVKKLQENKKRSSSAPRSGRANDLGDLCFPVSP